MVGAAGFGVSRALRLSAGQGSDGGGTRREREGHTTPYTYDLLVLHTLVFTAVVY